MRLHVVSLLFVGLLFQGVSSAQGGGPFEDFSNDFGNFIVSKPAYLSDADMKVFEYELKANPQRLYNTLGHLPFLTDVVFDQQQRNRVQTALKMSSDNPWTAEKLGRYYETFRKEQFKKRSYSLRSLYGESAVKGNPFALSVMYGLIADELRRNPSQSYYWGHWTQ